ncbi:MAG: hypothetical protein QXE13_07005, partial [Sulfolobales archaeon]
YRDLIEDLRIEAHVVQIANKGTIYFSDKPIKNWRDFVEKVRWGAWYNWVLGMVVNGIIPQPMAYDEQWTISIAHTREDIEKTIEIAGKVFREVREGRALRFEVEEAI